MSRKALLGILLGTAGLTLACLCAPLSGLPRKWTPTALLPTLRPTNLVPTSRPIRTAPVTQQASGEADALCEYHLGQALEESETSYASGEALETDFTLVTYTVSGDSILDPVKVSPIPPKLKAFQEDTAAQQKMWRFFTDVIPATLRTMVTQFSVFTDGPNNSLGAVEQTDDPRHWKLEMDIQDSQNFADLSTTLIHEFGHLLTLNEAQVTPNMDVFDHPNDEKIFDQAEANCTTYFMFEGCSQPESYINRFFQRFWPKLYGEWKRIDSETDSKQAEQDLDKFYQRYTNQFVSSYAVTSPAEDIAETFMYFIFNSRPTGESIADQKVLFFYDLPELKDLREHILFHLCQYVEKP